MQTTPAARPAWLLAAMLAGAAPAAHAAAPSSPGPDPAAAMRRIAAMPYRYGGALQGTIPGRPSPVDQPPLHLSVGLAGPSPDGRLRGEAILFTADRRLVATGPVSGRITGSPAAGPTAGTGDCTLRLALPGQDVTLSGLCTADTLSGEIVSRPRRPDLLTRLVSWWGDRQTAGRYWLTPASFDPAPSPGTGRPGLLDGYRGAP